MKKYFIYTILVAFVATLSFTSCKEEEKDNGFDVLKTYMVENNMDVTNVLDGWITAASAVVDEATGTIPGFYVIDIRSAADFALGHIDGAVNSTLVDILTTAEGAGALPILVVCYTGQGAGHGVVALRLSGYADAKVLKWGMSGWNPDFSSPWLGASGDDNGTWQYDVNSGGAFEGSIYSNSASASYPMSGSVNESGKVTGVIEINNSQVVVSGQYQSENMASGNWVDQVNQTNGNWQASKN